jgi:hypothetical protein
VTENTDTLRPNGTTQLADVREPETSEREPWIYLFYDDREDAFAAVDAAELLGLKWRLLPEWREIDEVESQQWVVEVLPEHTLPAAANSSIWRDVD